MTERELKIYKFINFQALKSFFKENDKVFTAAIDLQGVFLEDIKVDPDRYYIDITHWVENLNEHRDNIHNMQGLLNVLPEEVVFLCEEKCADLAMDIFRHNFLEKTYLEKFKKVLSSKKTNFGFDALNNKYCDMVECGIIDPTKVTRSVLQNAASVAATLLTTESIVTDIPTPPAPMAPGGGDMGGMY